MDNSLACRHTYQQSNMCQEVFIVHKLGHTICHVMNSGLAIRTIIVLHSCNCIHTITLNWSYTFIFILIYHCSIWTLTSINDTDLWTGYRLSSVTCLMTIRVWSTFFSNLSFDGASWKWIIIYLMENSVSNIETLTMCEQLTLLTL